MEKTELDVILKEEQERIAFVKATMPMAYILLLPKIIKVAREYGYTIALHGSLQRDFDLVAIPWTEEAVSQDALYEVILKTVNGCTDKNPTIKPHGRKAYTILLGHEYYIDLSIMPLCTKNN